MQLLKFEASQYVLGQGFPPHERGCSAGKRRYAGNLVISPASAGILPYFFPRNARQRVTPSARISNITVDRSGSSRRDVTMSSRASRSG